MGSERVDGLGSLVHELLAGPEQDGPSLLILALRLDEAHVGTLRGFDDRFGISRVVLLALHKWLDIAGAIKRTSWPNEVISRAQ